MYIRSMTVLKSCALPRAKLNGRAIVIATSDHVQDDNFEWFHVVSSVVIRIWTKACRTKAPTKNCIMISRLPSSRFFPE